MNKISILTLIVGSTMGLPATAADDYPAKPITLVVGYAPGGATDLGARILGTALSKELGKPVVVENKPGANSNIGAVQVARAKPDGYTLLFSSVANAINPSLYKNANYDFKKDFSSIGYVAGISNVLVVNPKLNIKSLAQYIDYAKKHPGKLTCASSSIGSTVHLSCELFKQATATDILHVPYTGSGPAVNDLLSGQVDSMFDNIPSSIPRIQSDMLIPLAVTSPKRNPDLPDVPTLREEGLKDFDVTAWFSLSAPAKTDEKIISRLNTALNNVLMSHDVKEQYKKAGFVLGNPETNTVEKFNKLRDADIDKWKKVIDAANLSIK